MNLSFLRPLALPRAATLRAFLTITTASAPKPTPIPIIISSSTTTPFTPASGPQSSSSNLPYHVQRTPSNSLPIYLLWKRGGNMHQTKVRKITGDVLRLRQDLQDFLGADKTEVVVNSLTRQIIVKVSP